MSSSIPRYSSSSELSNLSDSDWLDISSNQDSDEYHHSDLENDPIHRPLSRISSTSFESSQGDEREVETWEGLVDDVHAETDYDSDTLHTQLTNAAVATLNIEADNSQEEERVKEALDQSMMSTLSGSRPSSVHTRGSLNDLRLSFPDPLSSQEALAPTPFEELSVPFISPPDGIDSPSIPNTGAADPGLRPTSVVTHPIWCKCSHAPWQGLTVVLYGLPSHISFVRKFFLAVSQGFQHAEGCEGIPRLIPEAPLDSECSSGVSIYIQSTGAPMHTQNIVGPSLAITVYPFAPIALPTHSLYLPVIADPADQARAKAAWKLSGIPSEKTLLKADKRFSTVDEPIDPIRAHEALNRLQIKASRSRRLDITQSITPVMTLTSIFSLLFGIAIYAACHRPSITGTPTILLNHSTTLASYQTTSHPSSGTSLSLINTKTSLMVPIVKSTSLSVISQSTAVSKFTTSEACISVNMKQPISWTERARTSKDLVTRPIMSILPYHTTKVEKVEKDSVAEEESEKGVPEPSISDLFNARMEEMKQDFNELSETIDDMVKSLSHHTTALMEQSKESAQMFTDRIQRRHERARTRAKLFRNMGERVFGSAGNEVKDRIKLARQRAHAMRQCPQSLTDDDNSGGGHWGYTRLKRFGF